MDMDIEANLFQRFQFTKPIEMVDLPEGSGDQLPPAKAGGLQFQEREDIEYDINLIIQTDEENKADWDAYIETLKEYIRQEPDVDYFLRLPEVANAPYSVSVKEDSGFRFYNIKTIGTTTVVVFKG